MRSTTGKLLAEVEPTRRLLKFKVNGRFYFVDLDEYLARDTNEGDNEAQELKERLERLELQLNQLQTSSLTQPSQ